ncbi:hypothetical protein GGTG_07900 [Gaeumannomyces tritici R3-111a-1]|uniref:Uncharacterized protein n=1 Tax=Gaeumannomyces tritici (strain R3-111a-1) TaxID=644352 RepID=J3P309_GAET3|nr:hypothetical protein GGTG_07900 [Gaeumannomyces tritici R3-111a-1]EJT74051.1 hypothetical protein GGTG_07900 [Gaeumannomyces tritici R3-111a-1]
MEVIGVGIAGAVVTSYTSYKIWERTQQTPVECYQAKVGAFLWRIYKGDVEDE